MAALTQQRVFDALPVTGNPIMAVDLTRKLGLGWPGAAGAIREHLLALREEGSADIKYGYGWYRTIQIETME